MDPLVRCFYRQQSVWKLNSIISNNNRSLFSINITSKPNRKEPLMEVESFLIFSRCPDMTVIEDNSDQYHLE